MRYRQIPFFFGARGALCVVLFGGACVLSPTSRGQSSTPNPDGAILLREALVFKSAGRAARTTVHRDTVEARIISGQWHSPEPGEEMETTTGGRAAWETVTTTNAGSLDGSQIRGGYVSWPVMSGSERVMILEAAGHGFVYVNGEIRGGDPYANGYLRLPVLLRRGTNEFLFQCSRGGLRAKLISPAAALTIDPGDSTLPDIIMGEMEPLWGAALLLNASTNRVSVSLSAAGGRKVALHSITIPPLGVRKAPFVFYPPALKKEGNHAVTLTAVIDGSRHKTKTSMQLTLRVRRPDQSHKRTFISSIDGSVQYYAVNPPIRKEASQPAPALFLSLHGAGVEAMGQADAYSPKKWGYIVSPTNRRPYGFDWEEWGRLDALETLQLAKERFRPDPARIYLTGHSMGGHGTWQLGVLYPDLFAAIGPSAGWISFNSYASRGQTQATNPVQGILTRAAASSDTLAIVTNYLMEGVYILHGDADDNVPVSEARAMREALGKFHHDFDYHEQPRAGHWWDASDEPGTDCVDWAPMFDFFARHALPAAAAVREVRFATVNPAVSHQARWVNILAQEKQLELSAVDLRCDPGKRRISGTTTNVSLLWLDLPSMRLDGPVTVELDGQKLENVKVPDMRDCGVAAASGLGATPFLLLAKEEGHWKEGKFPAGSVKSAFRSGPFRQAFQRRMIFVYGTSGTPVENAWSLNKARYDAETFWYRGNGSVDLMPDAEYLRLRSRKPRSGKVSQGNNDVRERNVVLYGHAECNAAWPALLGTSPVQARRGTVKVGNRELTGEDLACLFLRPDPENERGLVGVVSGSGLPGLRLTERMPYFTSGVGFPDCMVVGADMLTKGIEGVRLAGFFGNDWSVEAGEWEPGL